MKIKYTIKANGKIIERQYSYIPVRYILAALITIFEVLAIIGIVCALCYFFPYFYLAALATEIACVIAIISWKLKRNLSADWKIYIVQNIHSKQKKILPF